MTPPATQTLLGDSFKPLGSVADVLYKPGVAWIEITLNFRGGRKVTLPPSSLELE